MDNNDISKLLRLKRYEQPPAEYFENFLAEFQLRQRAEVIHRPFFQIAWDRLCRFLTPPSMPRLAMAGSFAVAVIATGDEIVEPGKKKGRGQIRNSNGPALTAMAARAGADAIARDIEQAVRRTV
jgi:hypothetical protein